jgi:hypothetical protein
MAELKGINKLLTLCTDFINEIDDFEDVQLDTDFCCFPETKEIFVSVIAIEDALCEFMENLLERTTVNDISEFTWSLLHEVGHCETEYILSKRTNNHCKYEKRKIAKGKQPTKNYYHLTDEKMATNWAIKFVEHNYDFVKNFDTKILKFLKKFAIDNNIEM